MISTAVLNAASLDKSPAMFHPLSAATTFVVRPLFSSAAFRFSYHVLSQPDSFHPPMKSI